MTNKDEMNPTAEHDKGHSVPYLRLLPKAEKEKSRICKKRKAANNLVILNGTALNITMKIDVVEIYRAIYNSLLKNGTIKDYDEYLSYVFVHQKEIRAFIYPLCFQNLEGGVSK